MRSIAGSACGSPHDTALRADRPPLARSPRRDRHRMRTQVAIIGAGPAGLLLGHLLHRAGIDNVIVERHDRRHAEERIRAGVLEQGTIDTLDEAGVGERMHREGLPHDGIELLFDRKRHRIDLNALSGGRTIVVYGQHEVVKDLIAARVASRPAAALASLGRRDPRPRRRAAVGDLPARRRTRDDRMPTTSRVATASTASAAPSIPAGALTLFDRIYPFAWLGILADADAVVARTGLREPRARLRAVLDALREGHAPVPPVRARRGHRAVERRPHLGRTAHRDSRPTTAGRSTKGRSCSAA